MVVGFPPFGDFEYTSTGTTTGALTRRDQIAMAVLDRFLQRPDLIDARIDDVTDDAVSYADSLLARLDREEEEAADPEAA